MARRITYQQAINEALAQEMERDETVVLMGEDIAGGMGAGGEEDAWGGVLGVTKGLYHRFPGRVLDTPISESAYVGAAAGAAASGLRPVAELMFVDFMGVCFDQIFNQAAKFRYMFGGKAKTPMVIRTMWGAGIRAASQHSQSLHPLFTHIPGLKVVAPSTPYDAKGLLIQAIRDDDPVIFFEHKMLYATEGDVPEEAYTIPFAEANFVREGDDVTIVALGRMVLLAQQAAAELDGEGISCEIVDPRTTSPLDLDSILESVENTGRLVVVDEANPRCGFAADIVGPGRAGRLRRPQGRAADADPAAQPGALQPGARGRLRARRPTQIAGDGARGGRAPTATGMSADIQKLGMPKWGLSMTEGRLVAWLVDEGAEVAVGDEVAEVETDKLNGAVESPVAGVLRRHVAVAGRGDRRRRAARRSWPTPRRRDADIDAFVAEFQASFVPGESDEDAGPEPETVEVGARHPALPAPGRRRRRGRCSCTASAATSTTGSSPRPRWPRATRSTRSSCPATAARRRTSGPATSTSSSTPWSASSTPSSSSACTSSATRSAASWRRARRCATPAARCRSRSSRAPASARRSTATTSTASSRPAAGASSSPRSSCSSPTRGR